MQFVTYSSPWRMLHGRSQSCMNPTTVHKRSEETDRQGNALDLQQNTRIAKWTDSLRQVRLMLTSACVGTLLCSCSLHKLQHFGVATLAPSLSATAPTHVAHAPASTAAGVFGRIRTAGRSMQFESVNMTCVSPMLEALRLPPITRDGLLHLSSSSSSINAAIAWSPGVSPPVGKRVAKSGSSSSASSCMLEISPRNLKSQQCRFHSIVSLP